jgi:hypothetical protein
MIIAFYCILRANTDSEKTSHPAASRGSAKSGNDIDSGSKFANSDILADKAIPQGVLESSGNPGLAYQVVVLQDRLQLAQHIISGLRAELKQEKTVKCFMSIILSLLKCVSQKNKQLEVALSVNSTD